MRLLDDRDADTAVKVQALWAVRPLDVVDIAAEEAVRGIDRGAGGVLTAHGGLHEASVLVAPLLDHGDLSVLRPNCVFGDVGRTPASLEHSLSLLERWATAIRLGSGNAGRYLRRHVLREAARAIVSSTSPKWGEAERRIADGRQSGIELLVAEIPAGGSPRNWRRKLPTVSEIAQASIQRRISYLCSLGLALDALPERPREAVRRRDMGPEHPKWLAEFALRLASAPHTVRSWSEGDLRRGLAYLLGHPHLLRTARYFVLATGSDAAESEADLILYPSWQWPSHS